MNEVIRLLTAAKEVIGDPAHWTTGTFARDANDAAVFVESKEATQWCAAGALHMARNKLQMESWVERLAMSLFDIACGTVIGQFNDNSSHEQVLKMFDKVIETARTPADAAGSSGPATCSGSTRSKKEKANAAS